MSCKLQGAIFIILAASKTVERSELDSPKFSMSKVGV